MKRRAAWLLAAALVMAASAGTIARAQSLEQIWSTAKEAFFKGDFAAAARGYDSLIAAGVDDPDVHYDLGLAQARSGELGAAIASFERAVRLSPDDADAQAALAKTRAALGKRRAESQGEATVETRPPLIEGLVQPYRQNGLALSLLVLELLGFAVLIARRFATGDTMRTALAVAAASCLLSAAASGFALLVKRGAFQEGSVAVVLHEGAELREGPDPRARARGTAHEGARAFVLGHDGGFVRVRVENGPDGWMRGGDVAQIERLTR